MSDILTTWDPWALTGDWMLAGTDLAAGRDLETAVILSLFTDRLALADDPLPDPSDSDRRGWWADWSADLGNRALGTSNIGPIGSRLWLLSREKQLNSVRLRAEDYTREALAWMLEDEVADDIAIAAEWNEQTPGRLDISVAINRDGAQLLSRRFSWAWAQNMQPVR
jgi:phage gp46-like protein